MPVIHHTLPVMVTIAAWCPTCGRETKQTVECPDGGAATTHWCHRCLLPRHRLPAAALLIEGGARGHF